jgi:hypothetical protein
MVGPLRASSSHFYPNQMFNYVPHFFESEN